MASTRRLGVAAPRAIGEGDDDGVSDMEMPEDNDTLVSPMIAGDVQSRRVEAFEDSDKSAS